jgi:DNA mismatch repair protein MutS
MPLAVGACGAILSYVEETNRRLVASLGGLRSYPTTSGMALDTYTRRNLELLRNGRSGRLDGSLLAVLDRTRTPMGGRLLRAWLSQPLRDVVAINQRLDAVEHHVQASALRGEVRALLARVGDLERQTGRVAQGLASARELRDLASSLGVAAALAATLPAVADAGAGASAVDACPEVADLVERALAAPGSGRVIRPGYAPELDALVGTVGEARRWLVDLEQTERQRTGIKSLKVGFNKVFGYYLEITKANLRAVPDRYQRKQTLVAAERFITPELKACEARVLHAEDRILELEREVFQGVLQQVAAHGARLRRLASALAHLDVYTALAEVACERGYTRPSLDEGDEIRIEDGRHPVVEASLPPGSFIPNDCHLAAPARLVGDGPSSGSPQAMLLTGPNMAGKSTYLRQVALIVLMAQVGSFVPARAAHVGLVDRIFTRVGAQDDLAAGASTFMVEMMEAASILRHATARSLVVLDEIGRGTSTFDGLSIARAVVEEIHHRIGARTLFATHFHELASLADELPRVAVFNAAVAEENGDVVFLRRIVPGAADRSYGIHVARLAGLPDSVTHRAQVILRGLEDGRGPSPIRQVAESTAANLDGAGGAVLEELLTLNLNTLTPLDALNKLWDLQRRAGRA